MPAKKPAPKRKPKMTPAERHKRFLDMAREVGADEMPESFDKAFSKVTNPRKPIV
jgi:hypothetical protein